MIKTEANDDKSVEVMTSVGHALSKRREDLGYDINLVAAKLKLRVSQLEALEADNRNFFPGRPYYLGFLKAYAEFLGLDLKNLPLNEPVGKKNEILRSASPGQNPAHLPELRPLPGASKKSIPFWIFFVAGVALTVIAYIGWYQVTRPPHQVPFSEQAREENLETTIPPIAVEKNEVPLPDNKVSEPIHAKESIKNTSEKESLDHQDAVEIPPQKEMKITLLALKTDTPVDITDKHGKSIFSDSLEKNKKWISPDSDGKYFISVNDASAIAIKTKSGNYQTLGKQGEMLRNFDLSRLNGN